MYGASMASGGCGRQASDCTAAPDAGLPVSGSSEMILMPVQKLPKHSQCLPSRSMKWLGSMQLYLSNVSDDNTSPWSCQAYPGAAGSSVALVASPITEWLEPKVETA